MILHRSDLRQYPSSANRLVVDHSATARSVAGVYRRLRRCGMPGWEARTVVYDLLFCGMFSCRFEAGVAAVAV